MDGFIGLINRHSGIKNTSLQGLLKTLGDRGNDLPYIYDLCGKRASPLSVGHAERRETPHSISPRLSARSMAAYMTFMGAPVSS